MSDNKIFSDIKTTAVCLFLLPAIVVAIVKFMYQARNDLRLPNNDMWE